MADNRYYDAPEVGDPTITEEEYLLNRIERSILLPPSQQHDRHRLIFDRGNYIDQEMNYTDEDICFTISAKPSELEAATNAISAWLQQVGNPLPTMNYVNLASIYAKLMEQWIKMLATRGDVKTEEDITTGRYLS